MGEAVKFWLFSLSSRVPLVFAYHECETHKAEMLQLTSASLGHIPTGLTQDETSNKGEKSISGCLAQGFFGSP
jgi:hypothetical protein